MKKFTLKKKKSANKPSPKTRSQIQTVMSDIRYGRSVSAGFFRQNAWLLVAFLAAVLSLMGLRYKTKSKMAEIKTLTTELEKAQSSKLQEKSMYMSLIRETEMKRLVSEKGLGLEFREEPPYELSYEK